MHRSAAPPLGLALVALLAALPACGGGTPDTPARTEAGNVPTHRLALTTAPRWQAVSAQVATIDEAQALARIPGILTSLTVKAGDRVTAGQAIGRIVDSQLGHQSGAYGAQASAAQANAAAATAELKRVQFLHDNGVYAQAALDRARAMADAAQAQVVAAKQQQSAVNALAGQGLVVAPTSGRVLIANVPAGSPVAPGMSLATITSGPVILRLELPESLAADVQRGAQVTVSGLGAARTGTVTKIYPAVLAGMVRADAQIAGLDGALIGRRVAAQVAAGTRQALIVPAGLVTTGYGIDTVRVKAKDGTVATVPVQTARTAQADRIEILSGVAAGDVLLAGPAR
jgi:RND family efflux transporter MFP subunit